MVELDKLTLNNKIVDMRHSVKQSRIQAINKLVKEIQKLKAKKGTDEQKAKNSSKAERYVELIHIMKKVKDDDVSKFALINEKNLSQITNNVNELPEIKAVARIASHRPIYDKVKAFREKFVDWKEKLPLLFETLGEKYQNKIKNKNKNPQKSNKRNSAVEKKSRNEICDLKENSNVTYIHNKLGTWMVKDIEDSTAITSSSRDDLFGENDVSKRSKITNSVQKLCTEKKEPSTENNAKVTQSEQKPQRIKNAKPQVDEKKQSPTVDSFFVTKSEKIEPDVDEEKISNKLSKENKDFSAVEEKTSRAVDPFFVTKDNKEYLSVSNVNNTTAVKEKKTDFSSQSKFKNDVSKVKPFEKTWQQNKAHGKKNYPIIEEKKEALHPSWEAKRKQSSITKFQGKKIKFDD